MSVSTLPIKSERQVQIVNLASCGFTDKEIAVQTGLAVGTLRTYWDRLRQRYQCRNRAEVIATVLQQQAIDNLAGALLNSLPIFVWKVGIQGNVEYRNQWFAKHCQAAARSEAGIEHFMPQAERELFASKWQNARKLQQRFDSLVHLELEPNEASLYKISVNPIFDQDRNLAFWLGYGRESTNDADANMVVFLSALIA